MASLEVPATFRDGSARMIWVYRMWDHERTALSHPEGSKDRESERMEADKIRKMLKDW